MSGTIYIYDADVDYAGGATIVDHYDFSNQTELLEWLQRFENRDKIYNVSFD